MLAVGLQAALHVNRRSPRSIRGRRRCSHCGRGAQLYSRQCAGGERLLPRCRAPGRSGSCSRSSIAAHLLRRPRAHARRRLCEHVHRVDGGLHVLDPRGLPTSKPFGRPLTVGKPMRSRARQHCHAVDFCRGAITPRSRAVAARPATAPRRAGRVSSLRLKHGQTSPSTASSATMAIRP